MVSNGASFGAKPETRNLKAEDGTAEAVPGFQVSGFLLLVQEAGPWTARHENLIELAEDVENL
jgi:hypothetical protein